MERINVVDARTACPVTSAVHKVVCADTARTRDGKNTSKVEENGMFPEDAGGRITRIKLKLCVANRIPATASDINAYTASELVCVIVTNTRAAGYKVIKCRLDSLMASLAAVVVVVVVFDVGVI